MKRGILCLCSATMMIVAMFVFSFPALAEYPDKPITILCGFPPGSGTDLNARSIAEAAKKYSPQPFVVVNRPGGAGAIAAAETVQSPPDGYTIGVIPCISLTLQPHRVPLPYGGPDDYTPIVKLANYPPIVNLANYPSVLAVKSSAPWKTIQDFITHAKANPGKVNVGHPGIGTVAHINVEQLKKMAKIDINITPFAGGGEDVAALLGGHVEAVSEPTATVFPQIKAGRARCLGVFYDERFPALKDTPTFKESGYDITKVIYYLVFGPKGMPAKIVETLHETLKKGMKDPSFEKAMEAGGGIVAHEGPEDLKARLKKDYESDAMIVKDLKLK
jgi:tripartite-type tricarboxylate transporter receptor subunit TctC